MMLSDNDIVKAWYAGDINIDPFDIKNLGPNSYDLTLGNEFRVYTEFPLDAKKDNPTELVHANETKGILLSPNVLYLAHTVEIAGSDKYVPILEGRSSYARLGLSVHVSAGFGDVGFNRQWTLELTVIHPLIIYPGSRICQVHFNTLTSPVGKAYNGKYFYESGATPSKSHRDF